MALIFKGTNLGGFGGYELSDQIMYNIKWFLDWGMLNAGGFSIYQSGLDSYYDVTETQLHLAEDERFVSGIAWVGVGKEWVWESGVNFSESGYTNPFRVSGVTVNGTFLPTGVTSGVNGFHVDYLNGRILFSEPKNPDDDVRCDYTLRSVHVGFADSEDFRVIMRNAVEDFQQDNLPSGVPVRENQVWLPSVFIELSDGGQRGLQVGGGQIKTRYVTFHIFADDPHDRNLLTDWIDYQSRTTFWMADLNRITFPFDEYGDIVSGVTNWVNMTTDEPWKKLRVIDSKPKPLNSLNSEIFRSRVVWEVEVDFGGI